MRKTVSYSFIYFWLSKPHGSVIMRAFLVTIFLLTISASLLFLFESPNVSETPLTNQKRDNGNTIAAADLYGTGIRVGVYLQTLGLLLSASRFNRKSGGGIKLITSANMIAILTSWTVLVRRREISPCEAWLIVSLIFMLTIPVWAALCNPYTIVGEGFGIFLLCFAMTWSVVSSVWFWARLYNQLPLLGTPDRAWIFVEVSIKGWYRVFSLVMFSIDVVTTVIILMGGVYLIGVAVGAWWDGKTEGEEVDEDTENILKYVTWIFVFVGAWTWTFAIIGAEKMIKSNNLAPVTDLSQPGQSIPLTIGIIVLIDGIACLMRPSKD